MLKFLRSPPALAQSLLLAILLALFAGNVFAQSHPRTYAIGVEDVDYPPIFSIQQGTFTGYSRDLLDLFARHESIHFVYRPFPIRRLMKEYEKGHVDGIFPDNPKWDSADKKRFKVHYSAPALTFQDAIMVQADRVGQPMQSLGIIIGFQPWKFMDDIEAGRIRVSNAPGAVSLLQMVLNGRVDGGNVALQVARYHLARLGKLHALQPDPKLMPLVNSHYHLSSVRYPELIKSFDKFLLKEHIAVKALQQKYGF
ncbi:MAG TPA: transporter substrate-binding domain-containing protein [Oligoflexus sp.]|uniref:substrate-binding periplasmic protein n=1 Tax=Oligoflexus sp. TaxID=1971216 RepID=UPI002D45070B|nr:transporter substrate-binding domain-containing protein [Oligoflexus sp.]HYX35207.1 transporter substrate-binding domain-containing protein [Oligoflexus sp.]